jgi:3',5'-cyclic AMP phosphodiesterase CpdA
VKFSLAHFSDVHLGPLPKGSLRHKPAFKKYIGALSWHLSRKYLHLPEIAAHLRADVIAAKPDHIAFTGDLVNISAEPEFTQGAEWLSHVGAPEFVSYTPGNHDAYVAVPWSDGLGKFANYMTNENAKDKSLPFIRLRRNIALIGINAACPQSLLKAGGTVGPAQLEKLTANLKSLRERGFYRLIMIHHPPVPGLSNSMRELSDVTEIQSVLQNEGAELVIHGHNHAKSLNYIEAKSGRIPVIGVPSASMKESHGHDVAAWNLYEIDRVKGQWQTRVTIRSWNSKNNSMVQSDQFQLEQRSS